MCWREFTASLRPLNLVAVLAMAVNGRAQDSGNPKADLALLQGEWSMVSGTADGQAMPNAMLATAKRICSGDETTVTVRGQVFLKAKFTLDPSKNPKSIDYEMLDGFTKGKTQLGIYELSGDTVKFCFGSPGAERPVDFSSATGDGRTLSVWRRNTLQSPATTNTAGPFAKDIKPEALWDGRKLVPFRALDSPKMVPAAKADFLEDGDYVLGITANGESRAYPTRFIWWHHVVNDTVGKPEAGGGRPVAITYCSVCNTGIRYDRSVAGALHNLDFYGLYNGVVALCDRDTGSAFLQMDGRFVTGSLMGAKLEAGPLLDTTWGEWKKLHPATLVMSPETPYAKFYSPKEKPEPRGYDHFPAPFFSPTVTRTDKRLPFFEKVLGVTLAQKSPEEPRVLRRAYPIKGLKEAGCTVNDSLGAIPVAVFLDPDSFSATAFSRLLEDKTLTFHSRKTTDTGLAIFDQETGTQWDIEGRGQAGPLKGKSLQPLECHLSQWYGWVAYFPDTTIYGHSEPPQPADVPRE
ncbi:MAG: hypothetical protein C5B50_29295 [Verrucomicrobia bacterium]|nr:MAG: hypothetical protein C5B50_29295 [Verrucomicrobiota bacterium]